MASKGRGGADVGLLMSSIPLAISIVLGAVGWFVAFIAQCVAQGRQNSGSALLVGDTVVATGSLGHIPYVWFGIFVQLFVLIGVVMAVLTDSLGGARHQLSAWVVVALVFSVLGADTGVYGSSGSLDSPYRAFGAGYVLTAAADIIWLFALTAEEDSIASAAIYGRGGNGGLTHPGAYGGGAGGGARSALGNGSASYGAGGAAAYGGGISAPASAGGYAQPPYTGSRAELGNGAASGLGAASAHSLRGGAPAGAAGSEFAAPQSAVHGAGGAGSAAGHSPVVAAPASAGALGGAGVGAGARSADAHTDGGATDYGYRARALYAYTANADDPTEISFAKGEVLDIVDNSGKWWQARKQDGSTGIVPSNYMQLL